MAKLETWGIAQGITLMYFFKDMKKGVNLQLPCSENDLPGERYILQWSFWGMINTELCLCIIDGNVSWILTNTEKYKSKNNKGEINIDAQE